MPRIANIMQLLRLKFKCVQSGQKCFGMKHWANSFKGYNIIGAMTLVSIDAAMPPTPIGNFSPKHSWLLPWDVLILQSGLYAICVCN